MAFAQVKYQSDSGAIYKMRVSEDKETLAAGATPVAGALTDTNVEVYASGSGRRRNGIHARGVRMSRTVGTALIRLRNMSSSLALLRQCKPQSCRLKLKPIRKRNTTALQPSPKPSPQFAC